MTAKFNWERTKSLHNYIREERKTYRNGLGRDKEREEVELLAYRNQKRRAEREDKKTAPLPKYHMTINSNTIYSVIRKWNVKGKREVTIESGRKVNVYFDDGKRVQISIIGGEQIELALYGPNSETLRNNRITVSNGIASHDLITSIEGLIGSNRMR